MADLAAAEPPVKIAKLADIFDNLTDSRHLSPGAGQRTLDRSRQYLRALDANLPAVARDAMARDRRVVEELARSVGR